MKEQKSKLQAFLEEQGAWEKFKANLEREREDPSDFFKENKNLSDLFYYAFIWNDSPEGLKYWMNISDHWKEVFEEGGQS